MSQQTHTKTSEHGTLASYVAGFILSLFLTGIAYYSVVHESFKGNGLLTAILGLAVLQMFVQIVFFLHLGRGPKPLYNIVFFGGTAGIIVMVVIGSIFIMDNLHYNMSPSQVTKKLAQDEGIAQIHGAKTGACKEVLTNHKVTITKGVASPQTITAKLCDTITFINEDDILRDIAFGQHENHVDYGGEWDLALRTKYPKTLTLNQAGTYKFHDDLHPSLFGTFTVSE